MKGYEHVNEWDWYRWFYPNPIQLYELRPGYRRLIVNPELLPKCFQDDWLGRESRDFPRDYTSSLQESANEE